MVLGRQPKSLRALKWLPDLSQIQSYGKLNTYQSAQFIANDTAMKNSYINDTHYDRVISSQKDFLDYVNDRIDIIFNELVKKISDSMRV